MRRAVGVSKALDGLRVQLDTTRRGLEGRTCRVVTERHYLGRDRRYPFLGDLEVTLLLQIIQGRIVRVMGPELVVDVLDPLLRGPPFREPVTGAETLR